MTDALLEQIVERTLRFEGSTQWMYRDDSPRGVVTCGAGHALFTAEAALLLPWCAGTQPAQATQVRSDYLTVQSAPGGHTAGHYELLTTCRLATADILDLCRSDIVGRMGVVRDHFLPGLDSLPDGVQAAIADLAMNLGPYFLSLWPKLYAAIKAGDWREAAAQSHRAPPISNERNAEIAQLFLGAINAEG